MYIIGIGILFLVSIMCNSVALSAEDSVLLGYIKDGFYLIQKQQAMLAMPVPRPANWADIVGYYNSLLAGHLKEGEGPQIVDALSKLPSDDPLRSKYELMRNGCQMMHYTAQKELNANK